MLYVDARQYSRESRPKCAQINGGRMKKTKVENLENRYYHGDQLVAVVKNGKTVLAAVDLKKEAKQGAKVNEITSAPTRLGEYK